MQLTVTKISCTSCGAPYSVAPGALAAVCPFCDTRTVIGDVARESVILEAREAAPCRVSLAEFRHRLLTWMVGGDYTPDDLFAHASFDEQQVVLLPFWRLTGTFQATFTAQAGFTRDEKTHFERTDERGKVHRQTRTKKVTDWRAHEGEASGDYLLWAYAGERLPEALQLPCAELAAACTAYAPLEALTDAVLEDHQLSPEQARDTRAKARLQALVEARCEERCPGDKVRRLEARWTCRDETALAALHPFWLITFTYRGERFPVAVSAVDSEQVRGVLPEDDSRKERVSALYRTFRWTLGIGLLLSLLGLCAGVVPGIILGVLTAFAAFFTHRSASVQERALLERSRELRERAAQDAWEAWRASQEA